jgi:prolipoprotein diacylglyceryltransferase
MGADGQPLDSCARLRVGPGRGIGAYFAAGVTGILAGGVVGGTLSAYGAISTTAVLICVIAPQVGLIVGLRASQLVFKRERVVFYEMLAVCLGASALALAVAGHRVWPGLELVTIGIGTFLVFGRLGCLAVGCCHGRPSGWGIRYGEGHERAGFSSHYVGVRLFPIQLLESALTAAAVAVASVAYLQPHRPGEVVAIYIAVYGIGRFTLESFRGDAARPYWLGLSEAQWIALATVWVAAGAAISGAIGRAPALVAAAAVVTTGAIALAVAGRILGKSAYGLRQAAAIAGLSRTLRALSSDETSDLRVETVEHSGVRVSYEEQPDGSIHIGVSRADQPLDMKCAETLERQIVYLARHDGNAELVPGRTAGIYHVLLR